jgi:uncharacterized repeat protein (TIGR01451 family)
MIKDINKKRVITLNLAFGLAILPVIFLLLAQLHQGMAVQASGRASVSVSNLSTTTPATHSLTIETAEQTALNIKEWGQLAHDPQRTGYVPTELPPPWRVKWIWNGPVAGGDTGPAADHLHLPKAVQPIAAGGKLYLGHSDGIVRALSAETGSIFWSTFVGREIMNTGAYDFDTQSIYFGSTNGRLYRLRASDGQKLGEFEVGGQVVMAPLLVGDTVYIGSTNGLFYALDKTTLRQRWVYNAGAPLWASPAYSANHGGLVIIQSEDKHIHAVRISDGNQRWRVQVNADINPDEPPFNASFVDTYPVVSDVNDVVIVRSFLSYPKMDDIPAESHYSTVAQIRSYLTNNPELQSFFVLRLADGQPRYVAPVLVGGIGNGHLESIAPQAVVKQLADGTEVAYLLWRSGQVGANTSDDRQDTTIGEMNLATGHVRFVQDYRNQGTMRLPTDEQSPISMAGNTLFQAHWMTLGAVQITDRSQSRGSSYTNPIRTLELTPTLNTLAAGTCPNRNSLRKYCPQGMQAPQDGYLNDPGFYIYYSNQKIYDVFWTTPVRSAIISNGTIYWKSVDGAIVALQTASSGNSGNNSVSKTVSNLVPEFGETITYSITIDNSDGSFINTIRVTDTVPTGLRYVPGSLTATAGAPDHSAAPMLRWSGIVPAAAVITIRYAATITETKPGLIQNVATINTGPRTGIFARSAAIVVNAFGLYLPIILKEKITS